MNPERIIAPRRSPTIAGENGKFLMMMKKKEKETPMMSKKEAVHARKRRAIVRKGKCRSAV
jgi:hypothetical protein